MVLLMQEDVVLLLRGLSKGDGRLVDEDGLRLPPRRGNMCNMKVQGCSLRPTQSIVRTCNVHSRASLRFGF